jgi:CDP-diacylglycerol---serine O-phosphatidyltransferase
LQLSSLLRRAWTFAAASSRRTVPRRPSSRIMDLRQRQGPEIDRTDRPARHVDGTEPPRDPRGRIAMTEEAPVRHFSMIRGFGLADLFTIANGFCGVAAIFEAMKYVGTGEARHVYVAAALIPLALVLDVLDGRIARWRKSASPLGRELDSLADLISFGVAPAAIALAIGVATPLDQVILIFFALCGLSRLARYNVSAASLATPAGKVGHFEGTPIPTSVVPLGVLVLAFHRGDLLPVSVLGVDFHLPVLLFLASGCLMISKTLRIPKL